MSTNSIDPSKVKVGDTVTLVDRRSAAHDSSITPDPDWRLTGRVREIWSTHTRPGDGPYAWQVRIGNTPYPMGTADWTYTLTDHEPAPAPEVKPGASGTATVQWTREGKPYQARVFRLDSEIEPWIDQDGERLPEQTVTDFVPDDAEALRTELNDTNKARKIQGEHLDQVLAERDRLREEIAQEVRLLRRTERERDDALAEVERLRAARTLPTREHVAEAIRGGRTSLKDYLVQFGGVPEDRILASPAVYCVQPMDAATDVLALFEQGGAAPKVTQEQAAEVLWLNEYERPWAEVSEQDHAVYMNAAAVVVARMGGAE